MDKVKFADGSEFDCLFFGQATVGKLFITVNLPFADAAVIFSDPQKTREITYTPHNGETTTLFDYTVFEYMVNEAEGVRAALRKPYVGEV